MVSRFRIITKRQNHRYIDEVRYLPRRAWEFTPRHRAAAGASTLNKRFHLASLRNHLCAPHARASLLSFASRGSVRMDSAVLAFFCTLLT